MGKVVGNPSGGKSPGGKRSGERSSTEPSPIGDVLSDLFRLRGYGQVGAHRQLADLWREVAGEMIASRTRVVGVQHGVLQVGVENSALLQELEAFHKTSLLERLSSQQSQPPIRDVRFRLSRRVA